MRLWNENLDLTGYIPVTLIDKIVEIEFNDGSCEEAIEVYTNPRKNEHILRTDHNEYAMSATTTYARGGSGLTPLMLFDSYDFTVFSELSSIFGERDYTYVYTTKIKRIHIRGIPKTE